MNIQQLFGKKSNKPRTVQIQEYYGDAKPIEKSLKENLIIIKDTLGDPSDLIIREFTFGEVTVEKLAMVHIEGIAQGVYSEPIMENIMVRLRMSKLEHESVKNKDLLDILKDHSIPLFQINKVNDFKYICEHLLTGGAILFIDGREEALSLETKGWEDRGVPETLTESVVRGPKDSFSETIRTNTMLIRRRIKDVNLRFIDRTIGSITKTTVTVAYIEGIASNDVVTDLLNRIDLIDIDGVLETSYIEELTLDEPQSLFPTMIKTERPDRVAANLLEGRLAVLVDGTPHALILPVVFLQFFQAAEDYYTRSIFASFIRVIRILAFVISLLTPSIYIALTTFHPEMIPSLLLVSISGQREAVPFPALFEALIMEFTFEILREAGLRMPKAIGSAISIVGALVIGEAAVNAGIVSNFMVIVVAITAIASLIFPEHSIGNPARILRFVFIFLAGTFGLFGISIGIIFLIIHLCGLRSFGIPYMYPLAPFNLQGMKDTFFRLPLNKMDKRPNIMSGLDQVRQSEGQEHIKKTVENKQ